MENELDKLWNKIKETTDEQQVHLFVRYCEKLVQLKEEGKLTEEEASSKIIDAMQFDTLGDSPECAEIFDSAGDTEIPRTMSYVQPIGSWDAKTADKVKQEEWNALVFAIKNAKASFKIN